MRDRRITISPKVDRKTYFLFKDLCHAHHIPVEKGVEEALRNALQRAGVSIDVVEGDQPAGDTSNPPLISPMRSKIRR